MSLNSDRNNRLRQRLRKHAETKKSNVGGSRFNLPDGMKYFAPTKGIKVLDIVPYRVTVDNHPQGVPVGDIWYQRTVFVHYQIGPEQKTFICPRTVGKRCPICEYRNKLQKDIDPTQDKLIDDLKPKEREIYNVIDAESDGGKQSPDIYFWDFSYYLFGKVLNEELTEGPEEYADFAVLEEGYSLKVRFAEKSFGGNAFLETKRIDFVKRGYNYSESLLDRTVNLDTCFTVMSFEELERIFLGGEGPTTLSNNGMAPVSSNPPTTAPQTVAPVQAAPQPVQTAAPVQETPAATGVVCPSGGTFGEDTDALDECSSCKSYEACEKQYLDRR